MPGIQPLSFTTSVAVIGDIHGRSDLLARLLGMIGSLPVVSVGDVVDRGPDVRGCVDLLLACGAVGVMGNHEEWVRAWLDGDGFDRLALHPGMGGEATLRSYGIEGRTQREVEAQRDKVPVPHREWFASLVDVVDLEVKGKRYWVAHSAPESEELLGVDPESEARHLFEQAARRLRWGRYDPDHVADCGRPVVVGHMTRAEPEANRRCIAIDTGCGTIPGGALTAVLLPELRFVTVS